MVAIMIMVHRQGFRKGFNAALTDPKAKEIKVDSLNAAAVESFIYHSQLPGLR
jgi:hypothetical protein